MLRLVDVGRDARITARFEEEEPMSQKLALLVSVALTVFVVIVAGALATRLGGVTSDATPSADRPQLAQEDLSKQISPVPLEVVQQREQQYRQRIDEANARLRQADEQQHRLQARLQELQSHNATLLERERTYQQRLQEANSLLQQWAPATATDPRAPAADLQQMPRMAGADASAYGRDRKAEGRRGHERSHDRHEHDAEDDDD
jgi:hypothetical protein